MSIEKPKNHEHLALQGENSILYPENALARLLKMVPKHIWITFISACILGLLVHMFMLTNKFANHDDVGHLFSATYGVASGRWLLPYALKLDGSFSMPWLIGVISVITLAVSACLTVSVLKIRRPLSCILTAAIMVSYPTVSATFAYMFTADAYFLSLALACFAAYITNKYRFGFLGGIAAITFSLGIYQSYLGIAALLMVAILIFDVLDNDLSIKALFLKALKFLGTLAAGLIIYMLIVKLTTRATELVDYMGISEMGKISVSQLPSLILNAYDEFYWFFIKNSTLAHFSFLKFAFALTAIASLFLGFFTVKNKKLGLGKILLMLALIIVFPLAANIIYVMVPSAAVHLLMVYGMFGVLVAPLALSEHYMNLPSDSKCACHWLNAACCWIIVATMALTSVSYALYSNQLYLKMELSYEQANSYSTRLLGAIEGSDGYSTSLPIVLVGTAMSDVTTMPSPELDAINSIGVFDMKGLVNSYTYGYFLRRFNGALNSVYASDSDIAKEFAATDEVKSMPCYPSGDAIRIIDGNIVVKLGDTPLS